MGTYTNQAASYKTNADRVVIELTDMQKKFEAVLVKITVPKDGDYLTEHVVEELEKKVEEIKKLIIDINNRSSQLASEGARIDERIARELELKQQEEEESQE